MSCQGGQCRSTTGTGGTTGAGGTGGAGGNAGTTGTAGSTAGRGGTTGNAGTGGVSGTTGTGGRGGTTGSAGTGGSVAGNPPGWWTSGTMHGCPWTGVDTLNVGTVNTPTEFVTKNDSFATPYCISGTVGPDPGYNGVVAARLQPERDADQCVEPVRIQGS